MMFMMKAFIRKHKIILTTEMMVIFQLFTFCNNIWYDSSFNKLVINDSINTSADVPNIWFWADFKMVCAKLNKSLNRFWTNVFVKFKYNLCPHIITDLNVHINVFSVFSHWKLFQILLCISLIDDNCLSINISKVM